MVKKIAMEFGVKWYDKGPLLALVNHETKHSYSLGSGGSYNIHYYSTFLLDELLEIIEKGKCKRSHKPNTDFVRLKIEYNRLSKEKENDFPKLKLVPYPYTGAVDDGYSVLFELSDFMDNYERFVFED